MSITETQLLDKFLLKNSLITYDPYDIWKDGLGLKVKNLFNKNRAIAILPAATFTLFDNFINNEMRFFYKQQEYPIVRALAASALLNIYTHSKGKIYLERAKLNLDWLIKNKSAGYSGYCWGANMKWASKNGLYDRDMPFITNTPYILEALVKYQQITGSAEYTEIIRSVYDFIDNDLYKSKISDNTIAFSYAPVQENRLVVNANSYTLYSFALLYSFLPERSEEINNYMLRLFDFISKSQSEEGAWWYYADGIKAGNFIDCFHSCFVLKNLIKSSRICGFLPSQIETVIRKGYNYILSNFYDETTGLFRRFTTTDKLSIVKFDLYDNAEMLNLFYLLREQDRYQELNERIKANFIVGNDIYSMIDMFNGKKNKNTLRWATMPYLYSLSNVFY